MHYLSIFAVRKPVTITVIILIILLLGGMSLYRIGIALLPDLDYPVAAVVTVYPSAHAELVEQDVTIPLESALAGLSGVTRMDSYSMENVSAIIIQMKMNTNMVETLESIRSELAQAALQLPSGTEAPVVAKINPNDFPVMVISAHSSVYDDLELTDKLKSITAQLEQINGVAQISLLGAKTSEIQVRYDPDKLSELGLNPTLLQQLISLQNIVVPGGVVNDQYNRYNLRIGNQIDSIDQLGSLIVGQRTVSGLLGLGGLLPSMIQLSDIAAIEQTTTTRAGFTRLNGADTVLLRIMPQSGSNTVQIGKDVKTLLGHISQANPEIEFGIVIDQSQFIKDSVNNLAINGIVGGILAILVLYLFLRNIPSALIIGLSIPTSIMATFVLIYFAKLNLNLMTLGGLALGIGMLVDSSIIMLENIYRHRFEGKDPILAAEYGSKEIASAIIGSTATTLAVFIPVIFLDSIAGKLFRELGMTVSFSLVASLLTALTLVPMLTAKLFTVKDITKKQTNTSLTKIQKYYSRLLQKALNHKFAVIACVLAVIIIVGMVFTNLNVEFLPEIDENNIEIQIIIPASIPIHQTKALLMNLEEKILAVPEISQLAVQAGDQGATDLLSLILGTDLHSATLQMKLIPKNQRERTSREVANHIRQIALKNGVIRANVRGSSIFGSLSSALAPQLLIEIRGEDPERLDQIADHIISELDKNPDYIQIQTSQAQEINDLFLQVNPAKSILGGLTVGQAGLAVRESNIGIKATNITIDNKSLPVMLYPEKDYSELDELMESSIIPQISINGLGNQPVSLAAITEQQLKPSPPSIQRTNRQRVLNVIAQLGEQELSTATKEARQIISDIELPQGYIINIGGLSEVIANSQSDLYTVVIVAIILVYLVMAAQFESFIYPLCIMLTIPLAAIGAVSSLLITGLNLSITALIGIVMLIGIVVNNGIVLIDYTNRLRRRGVTTYDAVQQAAAVRLRPILMTALTTILGLLPMAFATGEGSELTVPMAVTIIGGLISSTFLTLFVLPIIYTVFSKPSSLPSQERFTAATKDN
ncbi:MAG: efflux RND transporter permease subunit [Firmicutes bacterium]|nr:efflux RND transporter permease subunit [Bacillota bacterium]